MKTIMKTIGHALAGGLLLAVGACGGLVEDINDDPNRLTSASYFNVLTGSQVGNIILQNGETARRAGIFCGYYTGIDRQHQGFSQYTLTTEDFDALWYDAYVDTYRNALEAELGAEEAGVAGVTKGVTQTMRALAIGTAASLYGDVPFQEAGRIEVENPAYEEQADVYAGVQALLDAAIANLESGTGRPPSGSDIYFDGDPAKWIEVAYTLKARFYMHTREYANAYDAALSGVSSMDNALYGPHGTAQDDAQEQFNLNYQFFAIEVRQADLVTSDFMTSLVQPDAASNPTPENYRGNGKTDETGRYGYLFRTTTIGVQPNTVDGFAAQAAPSPIVTYEENLLTLAEAGFRSQGFSEGLGRLNDFRAFMDAGGYLTGDYAAQANYDAYVAADFDNGGMENPDGLSRDDALLREILEERYVTFFGLIEGFNDLRRTMQESDVRMPVQPNTGSELPERFLYPQTEINRNVNAPSPAPGLFEPTDVNG